jgi:hypothetical protein
MVLVNDALALRVSKSTLSKNKIVIVVGDAEAKRAIHDSEYRTRLGEEAASKALQLVGLPRPFTGKAAMMTMAIPLAHKYSLDFERYSRRYGQGYTLKYHVDVDRLRKLFAIAEAGEVLAPGGPAVTAVNDLLNAIAHD